MRVEIGEKDDESGGHEKGLQIMLAPSRMEDPSLGEKKRILLLVSCPRITLSLPSSGDHGRARMVIVTAK